MNEGIREQELERKRRRIEKSGNRLLYGFIVFFLIGYGFFFSSKVWMKAPYEGVPVTEIGKSVTEEDRIVTIDSWKYSESQKKMEIIVEVENLSLDGIDTYNWTVKTSNSDLNTKVLVESKDLVVISVSDVPRNWTEAALTMELKPGDKSKGSEFKMLKMYTNQKHVESVGHIKEKSITGYRKEQVREKIRNYKEQLKDLRRSKKGIEEKMLQADKKTKELTDDMTYQTGQEQEKTGEQINTIAAEKESLTDQLETKKEEIKEMKEKIRIQQELLREL